MKGEKINKWGNKHMEQKRSSFTGKIGFVLAAAGSAVGLGNLWRFPYLAAKYGGGIFLLVYLILAVTFGFALMCAEIAIGRHTGLSAIGAFKKLNKKFTFLGYLVAVIPIIILPYYSVIGGWVLKYMSAYIGGMGAELAKDGGAFFGSFISSPVEPVVWFLLFLGITFLVVMLGIEKGVEKVSKIMMPVLVVLSLFIAIYTLFLPGAGEGIKYYLIPDFSKFSIKTVLGAMGQLFYSMSLAMGIMITYGSYMKKEVSIEKSVSQIEIFDTGIAILAGFMVIPAVVAFQGVESVNKGPGLMFSTLPQVFDKMPGGNIIGVVFFVLVLFAALTSSISLMETIVSLFCDKFKLNRKLTCVLVFLGCIILGLPSSLGFNVWSGITPLGEGSSILDFFDFASNSVLMPIAALLTCIFVGYVLTPKVIVDEIALNGKFKREKLFVVIIKYIAPICIVLILISSVLDALKIFTI